jgi:hypothetical protein
VSGVDVVHAEFVVAAAEVLDECVRTGRTRRLRRTRLSMPNGTVKLTLIMIYFANANARCGSHARRTVGILCLR